MKDYYSHCYGIRVLDELDVHGFFKKLNWAIPKAEECTESSISNITKVINEGHRFNKEFIKIENSFFEIIVSIAAIGVSIDNARVVLVLGEVIRMKTELTSESGAWTQYEHLAGWLIHLASILELQGTSIEDIYLDATLSSMESMSNQLKLGYSWHAYNMWKRRWEGIIASNRVLIKNYIEEKTISVDALAVVRQG